LILLGYLDLVLLYRKGEILGLRWNDIDFERKEIHVRQQITRINGAIKASDLKTESSFRVIPFDFNHHTRNSDIQNALIEHANKNNIDIPPFAPNFQLSLQGTVVMSEAGTPLEPRNFLRCFQNLAKQAGLPHLTVHDTRHIAATNLKDSDLPIKDAAKILGHAKPETTLKIYQHGTTKTQRDGLSVAVSRLTRNTKCSAA